jgi:molybdenum storage protein
MLIERAVIETMRNARHTKQIRIINGLKPGLLTQALDGAEVGSLIYSEPRVAAAAKGGR